VAYVAPNHLLRSQGGDNLLLKRLFMNERRLIARLERNEEDPFIAPVFVHVSYTSSKGAIALESRSKRRNTTTGNDESRQLHQILPLHQRPRKRRHRPPLRPPPRPPRRNNPPRTRRIEPIPGTSARPSPRLPHPPRPTRPP